MSRRSSKAAIAAKQINLRSKLWPDVEEGDLWDRKTKKGFTTIPRSMPLFMEIMDAMSKNKPVSSVYLNLWCRAFDEHMVVLSDKEELAFHSGFTGQRAVQTLNARLDTLKALGFIKRAPGSHGERSHALILNPYKVVQKHRKGKTAGLTDALYNALIERASEIKADDI